MSTKLKKIVLLRCGAVLLAAIMLFDFARVSILREIGSFLIVEDTLEPAAAIVALGGQPPFREMEAARLYHAGWAPLVIIVPGARSDERKALENLGLVAGENWELNRKVLIRQGVPASAILVPKDEAEGTLEELQAVIRSLRAKDVPVILVTSKFHTRRTRLVWDYVTEGRSRGIVRATREDPFDPTRWWRERRFVLSVVREYLGLINYYIGFPVGTGEAAG